MSSIGSRAVGAEEKRERLLDVAEASGVAVRAACRAGACGTCALPVRGETAYLTDPVFPPPAGRILVCCAVPVGPVAVDPQ